MKSYFQNLAALLVLTTLIQVVYPIAYPQELYGDSTAGPWWHLWLWVLVGYHVCITVATLIRKFLKKSQSSFFGSVGRQDLFVGKRPGSTEEKAQGPAGVDEIASVTERAPLQPKRTQI